MQVRFSRRFGTNEIHRALPYSGLISFHSRERWHAVWSRTLDGKTQDVFATQQEIASNVFGPSFQGRAG